MIVNLRESLNTRDRKSVNGNSKYYDLVNLYESCNLSADNKKTLAKMINNNASDKAIYSFLYECYEGKEDIKEDTVKKDGKWVNKGKEGTHGEFKTKKAADAQRKAMFANGYKGESLKESTSNYRDYNGIMGNPGATWTIKELKAYWKANHNSDPVLNEYKSMQDWLNDTIAMLHPITNDEYDESLKESLESEDGWSEEILDIVDPFFIEVEKVAYELRNTVRGAYRFGTTIKDLAQVFRGFSETTDDIANELDDNQEHLEEDWRTGTFTKDDLPGYRAEMKKRVESVVYSIRAMKRNHPDMADLFDKLTAELVDILSLSYMNESLKESISMSRKQMISYLERRYSKRENADRIEAILSHIYGSNDFPDDDPKEGMWANFTNEELRDAINSFEGYRKVELKESISIKEEPHEECIGNNCTDEHDLFPEEKYFTIVVTRSDDGEDEIIDDVTKEIADKYIDDLKRDNDEFFSHAKVLDHNGKVVNSWEYLEEDYKMDRFSAFLDDDRKQRLKMQARKDKERAESIFSIHGNVFRKNGIDADEVVVARNLSWQEAKDKLDRMQYNSNAIDMYADVWIYNDTLDREEEHWDTKGYFKDEENNYYESCSKDFEEAVKSKKSSSVKDRLKKLIPDLDI